ncbi:MAG TPA: GNAT family N-acetyltransferase [Candidatus Limnocylindrales bacterium]|nr:GNAT family N-acetyltransferase [Candidatus Limnocylindrales bacterium]
MGTSSTPRWLELDGAPAIPGLRTRSFLDASDYERLSTLLIAAHTSDGIPWMPTPTELRLEMEAGEGADPIHDVVLTEADDRVVAAAGVERAMRDGVPTYEIWGAVDPAFRRRGLGTALLGWNLARVRVRASREDPGTPVTVRAFAQDTETGHRVLIDKAGFEPIRHFYLMRRPTLDGVHPVPIPEGLEVRPVIEDQHRVIFDAENEAFRDHWGHREMVEGDYARTYNLPELDTNLWVVAWDGDEVAGVVQSWVWPEENRRLGVRRGWLEHISVRRPWRRRGLATALTSIALVKLRQAGLDEAMLGVDTENATGALGLYEGLGFEEHSRGTAYYRDLRR